MSRSIARVGAQVGLGAPYRDGPLTLRVSGQLFVDSADGVRHHAIEGTLGLVLGRGRSDVPAERASKDDIERSICSMVGMDSGPREPSELAIEQLSEVLEQIGATEAELMTAPFVIEFSEELLALLDS
jgi:hypothetical protein